MKTIAQTQTKHEALKNQRKNTEKRNLKKDVRWKIMSPENR